MNRTRRVAAKVRDARLRLGLSQQEVARAVGRLKSWYVDVERGRTIPAPNEVGGLASALHLDPADLSADAFLDRYQRAVTMLPPSWFHGVGEALLGSSERGDERIRERVEPASYAAIQEKAQQAAVASSAHSIEAGEHIDVMGILMDAVVLDIVRTQLDVRPQLLASTFPHEGFGTEEGRCEYDASTDTLRICLREDVWRRAEDGEGRSRFTASHELGHALLHWKNLVNASAGAGLYRDVVCTASRRAPLGVPVYAWSEWQANAFAGAFLMPRDAVARFLERRAASQQGCDVDDLAQQFKVSHQAAEIRMTKLLPQLVSRQP